MNILRLASLLFLWLAHAAAENVTLEEEELGATSAPSALLENMTLLLYTGDTVNDYTSALVGDAASLVANIDSSKPTVFYIFGWTESPKSESVSTIIGAYLKRSSHNVILVNWEELSQQSFLTAVRYAESIGKTVAKAMDEMVAAGLNSSTIHIVSHSLGSQITGFVGKNANFTLPRITGLDPAGPGFYILIPALTSADADFVDIIYTDAGVYGVATGRGTANFFPNGGTRFQPGCPKLFLPLSDDDFCSHQRSWHFYAESVHNENAFIGVACDSNLRFFLGGCSGGETVVMGFATPTTTSGNYYLQTNSASPYGRGKVGAMYVVP